MKKFIKIFIFLILIILSIAILFYGIYTKYIRQNVLFVVDTINEIEQSNKEFSENNTILPTTQKNKLPIVVPKPDIGSKFGILEIPSINVQLDMLYGTTSNLLKKGVGHDNSSYLPGEGGSIILMGHNFKQFLGSLPNAKIGDEIKLTTDYGEYSYYIYDTKIVKETEVNKVPVQKEEEILMIYTCWPINNITHANERYVVYAK